MTTSIVGKLPCPDCKSEQDVKHDGRKYFINCGECRTMSTYQSTAAKDRIEQRLGAQLFADKPGANIDVFPENITSPTPAHGADTPVNAAVDEINAAIFGCLDDLFDDDNERTQA